jgi:NADPH:quinone reductase-like Zn-dependent oxidoreductase
VKAIVQDRFGPPDVLRLSDTGLPEAGPDDVLVRVHAAALNPADWHILRGDPLVARLMGVGLTRPKARVAGIDAAGVVEAAGANVRGLASGDDVLGFFRGAFAEYACAAADLVVPRPAGLTFEQAAAVPIAATTALRGIRDVGQVTAGQRVLVNGPAAGSAATPSRSRRHWALRSPGCAARATSSWCARSAPRTSSTTRPTTSPAGGRGTR